MGTEWQVWDVVPQLSERRSGDYADRRVEPAPVEFADRRAADRRDDGRRVTQSRRSVLSGNYAHGWLCFESDKEKRRLSPIPDDWTDCSEALLEVYRRHADTVSSGLHARDDYSADGMAETG